MISSLQLSQRLTPDSEAKQLWLSVGVKEDHIIPGNMKDNFWYVSPEGLTACPYTDPWQGDG